MPIACVTRMKATAATVSPFSTVIRHRDRLKVLSTLCGLPTRSPVHNIVAPQPTVEAFLNTLISTDASGTSANTLLANAGLQITPTPYPVLSLTI